MALQKSLPCKHAETLLNSGSQDNFDINGDRTDYSNSDVTNSHSTDESNNDSSNSGCDISTTPAQKKKNKK
jgi:hypothetical protein